MENGNTNFKIVFALLSYLYKTQCLLISFQLLTLLWYLFMCFVCDFEGEFLSNGFLLNVVGNFLICGVGQVSISPTFYEQLNPNKSVL